MPRVPHPNPLYPVVRADTPRTPDTSSTPTIGAAPPDDDDPIRIHLDEALVRKADNDVVDQWKALSGPWFGARGEEAATRWEDIRQALNEIVRRPLGELETLRQRTMYRDIMEPRLTVWGDEALAHAEREARAFNDAESQRRQDLAQAAMRRGARLNDMRAMTEGERRLVGEVRERSRRQGLDPDAARTAEADALGAALSDVVEDLAHHDPQQAQSWLNGRAGTIGDPAKVDRLNRMLQPYVAEQQQEGLAELLRGAAGDLPAQHAAVDAMGLDPEIADGLKERLAGMAEGDRRTAEKEQDDAFARVMAAVRDPATQSLRSLSPSDYDMLSPERQEAVRAIVAANLRGDGPATDPNFYASFANKLPQGAHADDEIPRAFEISPHPQAVLFGPTSGNAVSAGSEDQPFDDSLFLSSDKNSDIHVGNTDPINTIYDPDSGRPIFERTSLLGDVRRKWNESWTAAAKKSVSKVISDPKTSRPAKEILESFLSGKGKREFYYGPKSEGLKCTLWVRRDNQGQFWITAIASGGIPARNG